MRLGSKRTETTLPSRKDVRFEKQTYYLSTRMANCPGIPGKARFSFSTVRDSEEVGALMLAPSTVRHKIVSVSG